MSGERDQSPWICHICDFKSADTVSTACSVCYKITCGAHLRRVPAFNPDSGLFELQPICLRCAVEKS